jgi:uncharacterized protein (TIGR04255 family)
MVWHPAHEDHAIERVALTFQFQELVPQKAWTAILRNSTTELPNLGFSQSIRGIQIVTQLSQQIPSGKAQPIAGISPLPEAFGRSFQLIANGRVEAEVILERNFIAYSSTQYSGWAKYKERCLSLISKSLNEAMITVNIQLVKLEYWDRFVYDGPVGDANYLTLLNANSRYLPSFGPTQGNLWHSHVGFFAPADKAKRLINFNVDVLDLVEPSFRPKVDAALGQPMRSVGLFSMAQDTFDHSAAPETSEQAISTLDDMHTTLKELLGDVITPEAANRISLNAGAQE